jgi:hypothetical protein
MNKPLATKTAAGILAVAFAFGAPARDLYAQDALQQVKALYASAAYEDALTMVSRIQLSGVKPEVEQYRVFCLVALGRTAEAEKAIAGVVKEDPAFLPDATETSPRIHEMFTRVRRTLVPEIAQQMYLEGRGALDRRDREAAMAKFSALVSLIDATFKDSPEMEREEPMLGELKLLASGFLDLSRAAAAEAKPKPETTPTPTGTTGLVGESGGAAAVVRAPVQVTPAVPIRQELPAWLPPDVSNRREFRGAIRVFISEAGRVTGVELAPAIHPLYDRQLQLAAKTWEYQPAMKNGVPIASEKVIEVVLKPR